jgi:hypothetical protein
MTPLAGLLLKVMRVGALGAAGLLAVFIGIEGWTHWREGVPDRPHINFMAVIVIMLLGSLWLAYSISREIKKSGP